MRIILVPHEIQQRQANLWVAATDTPSPPQNVSVFLTPGNREIKLLTENWRRVTVDGVLAQSSVFVQTVTIPNLQSETNYQVETREGTKARFSTLPASLPEEGRRPFTVLLSSCFHQVNDQEGRIGRAVKLLPEDAKPIVKILCGDQVYLDMPVDEDFPDDTNWLAENFLGKYLRTWGQREGYQALLENGATYFTADDHEFWNNYPNWATIINNTWREEGRERWKRVALALYKDFQSDDPSKAGHPRRFNVGKLSFFIADTRVFREKGNENFMSQADFTQLKQWIQGLQGTGVLVVGQPIFHKREGWFSGRFADRALPNYEKQYPELVRALFQSQHSILVLTGDVHYGRVASCELRSNPRPVQLVEVISSPSSLVDKRVGGKSEDAPPKFPSESIKGVVQLPTKTYYSTVDDQFATLHFTERAGRVRMRVRYWFPKRLSQGAVDSKALEPIDL